MLWVSTVSYWNYGTKADTGWAWLRLLDDMHVTAKSPPNWDIIEQ